jgi:hypothetical protein
MKLIDYTDPDTGDTVEKDYTDLDIPSSIEIDGKTYFRNWATSSGRIVIPEDFQAFKIKTDRPPLDGEESF